MDEIINDFHDLDQIPVFQTQIDPEMMNTADRLDVLQMNIGRVCNLACKHCHVCAGPNRTEVMSREVMADCIQFAREQQVQTIDITGGAPEMNPDFEWLVTEACKVCSHVIVRTNLTVLLNPEYEHLIEFYARQKVEIVCSLPYYRADQMDRVRGTGTFDGAIQVLQKLNTLGYGKNPELVLNMVYNPAGAFFNQNCQLIGWPAVFEIQVTDQQCWGSVVVCVIRMTSDHISSGTIAVNILSARTNPACIAAVKDGSAAACESFAVLIYIRSGNAF